MSAFTARLLPQFRAAHQDAVADVLLAEAKIRAQAKVIEAQWLELEAVKAENDALTLLVAAFVRDEMVIPNWTEVRH